MARQRLLTSWSLLVEHGKEGPAWGSVGTLYLLPGLIPIPPPPPSAAVTEDMCPLRDLLRCLPDTPVGLLGLAATPSGSSSSSTPGARGPGSPLPISE